jgi:hypothetical protein
MLITCVTIFLLSYTTMLAVSIATMLQVRLFSIHLLKFAPVLANIAMSSCNPYIYTLFSAKFRRRFAEILCCGKMTSSQEDAPAGRKNTASETLSVRHKRLSIAVNHCVVAQKRGSTASQPVYVGGGRKGEGDSGKVSLTSVTFLSVD